MSITESTHSDLTESALAGPVVASPTPPAPPIDSPTPALAPFSFGLKRDRAVSIQLSVLVVVASLALPWFLFVVSPANAAETQVAGYVTFTSTIAMLALYPVLGLAIRGSRALGKMMFGVVGLGLIAQAACAVDGHVSVGEPHFLVQVVSWLAFGALAIGVTANTKPTQTQGV